MYSILDKQKTKDKGLAFFDKEWPDEVRIELSSYDHRKS
jgi:hypothetical protein